MPTASVPHVRFVGVSKDFGGVQALRDVSLEIAQGTVHGLVGENGAGKSTLGKILSGVIRPDRGAVEIAGSAVTLRSPHDALAHGVTTMAQEISLVPDRSVIENVMLGIEDATFGIVRRASLERQFERLCEEVGFALAPHALVGQLRPADQQKVELLRAVARNAQIIIMDEPTATLTADEIDTLLSTIRSLRARGTTILYVSHFLREILAISDTVTVMRDGEIIQTSPAIEETPPSLVRAMLGRPLEATFPAKQPVPASAPVAIAVRGISNSKLKDVSLEVREGEILGLAGLVGSGRSEVLRAIFGADAADGQVALAGSEVAIHAPRDAIRAGIAMVPESRKTEGLILDRTLAQNVTLAHPNEVSRGGVVNRRREQATVGGLLSRLKVGVERSGSPVQTLSGGNQQRVLFAKWLLRRPRVLLADEPTRGIDIGSKRDIYDLLRELATEGVAIVLVSSEVEELIGLAHRIVVMRNGKATAELSDEQITEQQVISAAFGASEAPDQEKLGAPH
jgi:rhamnose transport system ATP-binding protein